MQVVPAIPCASVTTLVVFDRTDGLERRAAVSGESEKLATGDLRRAAILAEPGHVERMRGVDPARAVEGDLEPPPSCSWLFLPSPSDAMPQGKLGARRR